MQVTNNSSFNKSLYLFKDKTPESAEKIHEFLENNREIYFKKMDQSHLEYLSDNYMGVHFLVRKKEESVRYYISTNRPLGTGASKIVQEHFKYPKGTPLAFGTPKPDSKDISVEAKEKTYQASAASMKEEFCMMAMLNKSTNFVLKAKFFAQFKNEEKNSKEESCLENVVFATEKCDGTLAELLDTPLNQEQRIAIVKEVLTAFKSLHQAGFVHRDVKLDNIFFIRDEEGNIRIKIADLGFTCSKNMNTGKLSGNGLHMSPEICSRVLQRNFSLTGLDLPKAEAWAVGLICYRIYKNTYPDLILRGEKGLAPYRFFSELVKISGITGLNQVDPLDSIIAGLLEVNPAKRSSLEQACDSLSSINS